MNVVLLLNQGGLLRFVHPEAGTSGRLGPPLCKVRKIVGCGSHYQSRKLSKLRPSPILSPRLALTPKDHVRLIFTGSYQPERTLPWEIEAS